MTCDAPHDTEFVGAWTAPAGDRPAEQRLKELAGDACDLRIAQFLGVSPTQLYQRADIYTFWTGLFLPAKTPRGIVEQLYLETQRAQRLPEVRDKLAQQGVDPMPIEPAAFDAQIRREIADIQALAKAADIKLN